jgi:hypothetical protein
MSIGGGGGVADQQNKKILVSFFVQTFVSLALSFWVFFLSKLGRLKISHERGSEEYKVELGRWRIISRCIMVGNDVQLMLGQYLLVCRLMSCDQTLMAHKESLSSYLHWQAYMNTTSIICD